MVIFIEKGRKMTVCMGAKKQENKGKQKINYAILLTGIV